MVTATARSRLRSKAATSASRSSTEGIRLTPEQIAKAALEEGVHLIGLSVLSGSHVEMVEDVFNQLTRSG